MPWCHTRAREKLFLPALCKHLNHEQSDLISIVRILQFKAYCYLIRGSLLPNEALYLLIHLQGFSLNYVITGEVLCFRAENDLSVIFHFRHIVSIKLAVSGQSATCCKWPYSLNVIILLEMWRILPIKLRLITECRNVENLFTHVQEMPTLHVINRFL